MTIFSTGQIDSLLWVVQKAADNTCRIGNQSSETVAVSDYKYV